MENIYKENNGLGTLIFEVSTDEGACKFIFNDTGRIIKVYCGKKDNTCLVYSKEDENNDCLKSAMIEMRALSQQCFNEIVAEIKSEDQLLIAKEIA